MREGEVLDPAEVAFFSDLQRVISRKAKHLPKHITKICGVDAAYEGDRVFGVARLLERGRPSSESFCAGRCTFPYASDLFYLREGPSVVEAVRRLGVRPQLVCFDAHGTAHPRSAGLATICGMVLGIPSVGIAKSRLVGTVLAGDGLRSLVHHGKKVGFVTGAGGARRYWSPGYSVTLRELQRVVENDALVCLQAINEAHKSANLGRSSSLNSHDRPL